MKIGVIHEITDPESFDERGTAMMDDIPKSMKNHQTCVSTDGAAATCVWEAESLDELSQFIGPSLGDASEQQYFEINEEVSVGIPD